MHFHPRNADLPEISENTVKFIAGLLGVLTTTSYRRNSFNKFCEAQRAMKFVS